MVSRESKISSSGTRPVRFFQKSTKARISIVLLGLAQIGVGVAEDPRISVLGEECQQAFLPAAALGNVVFFDQGVLAVEGDGMEVQVEGPAMLEAPAGRRRRATSAINLTVAVGRDAATVFGEERTFGNDVQSGKQPQPLIQDMAHDVAVASVAEELEGQQRPHGAAGGDHLRAGEAGLLQQPIQPAADQVAQKQEQAAELRAERLFAQVELADVGNIGGNGPGRRGAFLVAAAWQPGEALELEDLRRRRRD